MDFEINWTKSLNLGCVLQRVRLRQRQVGCRRRLPYRKGAAFEQPQTTWAGGSTAQCAQICWFFREARNPDFYVKFPSFKMLATNPIILCRPQTLCR